MCLKPTSNPATAAQTAALARQAIDALIAGMDEMIGAVVILIAEGRSGDAIALLAATQRRLHGQTGGEKSFN